MRPTLTTLETSRAQLHEARRIFEKSRTLSARAKREAFRTVMQMDKAFKAVTAAFNEAQRRSIKEFKGAAE